MDELLQYYQKLDTLVRKMRTAQIEARLYRSRSLAESGERYAKQIDQLIKDENNRRKQLEREIKNG